MREVTMKRTYGSNEITAYITVDTRSLSRRTSLYFDLSSLADVLGLDERAVLEAMSFDLAAKNALALVRIGSGELKRGIDANNLNHLFKMLVNIIEPETLRSVMSECQAIKQELQQEILT